MANPVGRPPIFKSSEEMQLAIDEYFENGAYEEIIIGKGDNQEVLKDFRPTMSGLALSLGMDRRSLVNYSHKDEFFLTIKKARARVEEALEKNLYNQAVTGTIFNLKNNFGWDDKQQTDIISSDGSMTPSREFSGLYGNTESES